MLTSILFAKYCEQGLRHGLDIDTKLHFTFFDAWRQLVWQHGLSGRILPLRRTPRRDRTPKRMTGSHVNTVYSKQVVTPGLLVYKVRSNLWNMMTSSNGNIFRVTGHLCGEFTGPRWIPRTRASDAELWCFCDLRLNKRVNNREADDLRRYRAHYDVTVMNWIVTDDRQVM